MTGDFEQRLNAIDRSVLTPLVCRALNHETIELLDWQMQPLTGGFSQEHGESYGIYRFQGRAQVQGERKNWSLVLKAVGAPASGSHEPSARSYWKREALVYQSGLLTELPGDLHAPRCFGVTEYAGEELWIWLEDIVETEDGEWPLQRYGLAARALGHLNGAYLEAHKRLSHLAWLSSGLLRPRLASAEAGIDELPALRHHPFLAELLPGDTVERMLYLWRAREPLLALLARLPQTLCHHDAFRRNLLARRGPDGRQQIVAIDWAKTGSGVIGEELVPLFATTLRFVTIELAKIAEMDALIFAGYVDGLRAAGWQGDARLARFGYAATAALSVGVADPAIKLPNVARRIAALAPGEEPPRLLGPGPAQYIALQHHLLDLGDEARSLLGVLG
jgi:hypothetical protein